MGKWTVSIWWVLWGLVFTQVAWADCPEDLAKLAAEAKSAPAISFPKWSFKERDLKLSAANIFPIDFIQEVEEKVGPFEVQVLFSWRDSSVRIQGIVKNNSYFTVSLFENPEYPGKLLVDQLRLENPLEPRPDAKLNLEQRAKGLPPSVFRYVQKNLFEIAKAGGFDEVFTNSQQHFAVTMLYRKVIGMEPAQGLSKDLFNELEKIYSFARRDLPQELRPADVRSFTELLGTVGSFPAGYTPKRAASLEHYFKTGELDSTVQIFKDNEGKPICALFNDGESAASRLVFISHQFGEPRLVNWLDIVRSKRLALIKKL